MCIIYNKELLILRETLFKFYHLSNTREL